MRARDLDRALAFSHQLSRTVADGRHLESGDVVIVALSGGLDSTALLHVLRFFPPVEGVQVVAAHLDHAWRPTSGDDADWVRGLTRAWGVRLEEDGLSAPPATEAEARALRYRFLHEVRDRYQSSGGGRRVVIATAHHADDQAETVLFRVLRGTGQRGLRAILPETKEGVIRPLLGTWRAGIEEYAKCVGLRWREDPTNQHLDRARNVLRHSILPQVEDSVASGARRSLVRLAKTAWEEEAGLEWLVDSALDGLLHSSDAESLELDRDGFLALPPSVRGQLLRAAGRRLGGITWTARLLSNAGRLIEEGQSGRGMDLPGGFVLERSFGTLRIGTTDQGRLRAVSEHSRVVIGSVDAAEAVLSSPEARYRAAWGPTCESNRIGGDDSLGSWAEGFPEKALTWPLTLRWWEPGDRVRLPGGTVKLKKVFGQREVSRRRRAQLPVLVDGKGGVLWVPGVVRSVLAGPSDPSDWLLAIEERP